MTGVNDIPAGLRIPTQIPLDAKGYFTSQSVARNLGSNDNLAYTYEKGLQIYCAEEGTRWEWREPRYPGEVGLRVTNFTYPNNVVIFGVDYSLKQYNFFAISSSSNIGETGPAGPPGPIGPIGLTGPVGPAGLTWQGLWVIDTAYVKNDAVGYNGASWFLYADNNTGSESENPEEDSAHWALLAAEGVQGPQGPPGVGIYTEESMDTWTLSSVTNPAHTGSKITENFTKAFVPSAVSSYLGLSDIGKTLGQTFVVRNVDLLLSINVVLLDNARLTGYNGFDTTQNYEILPNTSVRFTLSNVAGGSDKVFTVEILRTLGELNLSETLTSSVTVAPFPYSKLPFVQFTSTNTYALPPRPFLGQILYVKTAFSNCTLYASPNPGVDGSDNNFLTPSGNGNSSVSLLAGKCYRFTYIGRFGGTYGFWTIELMNNI